MLAETLLEKENIISILKAIDEEIEGKKIECSCAKNRILDKKLKIVYLDWNIIKKIKEEKMNYSNSNYIFPFSLAHLRDIFPSMNKENFYKFNEDLQHLSMLSNNLFIDLCEIEVENNSTKKDYLLEDALIFKEDVYEKLLLVNEIKIKEDNIEYIKNIKENIVIQHSPTNMFGDTIAQKIFEENNYVFNSVFMLKFFDGYLSGENNIYNDQKLYKEFRDLYKNKKPLFDSCELRKLLNFFQRKDNFNDKEEFIEIVEIWNKLCPPTNNTIGQKIFFEYMLLDFCPYFADKMKGKNKLTHIETDSIHLKHLLHCDYFITLDKTFLKKVKFLFELHSEIQTKILSFEDLKNSLKKL